jgi:NAD(P)-dependent dehydrogenase (short-subunit alcohol dehydrogenase family)
MATVGRLDAHDLPHIVHLSFQCGAIDVNLRVATTDAGLVEMNNTLRSRLVAGKVAFVTGAAKGLGRAIAHELAAGGASGTMIDILPAEEAGELPHGWAFRQGDVTSEDDVHAGVRATCEHHGGLDIVVVNAGVVPLWRTTQTLDIEEWRRTFAVNVEGAAITIKVAAQQMSQTGGSIVALGSLNSWQGHPQQAAYVASKHAVIGLVRSAALDLGRFNIRVNALAPGPIATEALVGRVTDRAAQGGPPAGQALQAMADAAALGRMASEADVAAACLFLASDLASAITGQLIPVDAGLR